MYCVLRHTGHVTRRIRRQEENRKYVRPLWWINQMSSSGAPRWRRRLDPGVGNDLHHSNVIPTFWVQVYRHQERATSKYNEPIYDKSAPDLLHCFPFVVKTGRSQLLESYDVTVELLTTDEAVITEYLTASGSLIGAIKGTGLIIIHSWLCRFTCTAWSKPTSIPLNITNKTNHKEYYQNIFDLSPH